MRQGPVRRKQAGKSKVLVPTGTGRRRGGQDVGRGVDLVQHTVAGSSTGHLRHPVGLHHGGTLRRATAIGRLLGILVIHQVLVLGWWGVCLRHLMRVEGRRRIGVALRKAIRRSVHILQRAGLR